MSSNDTTATVYPDVKNDPMVNSTIAMSDINGLTDQFDKVHTEINAVKDCIAEERKERSVAIYKEAKYLSDQIMKAKECCDMQHEALKENFASMVSILLHMLYLFLLHPIGYFINKKFLKKFYVNGYIIQYSPCHRFDEIIIKYYHKHTKSFLSNIEHTTPMQVSPDKLELRIEGKLFRI